MKTTPRIVASTLVMTSLLAVDCGGESLMDLRCPCTSGYICCPESNTCAPSLDQCPAGDGGTDSGVDSGVFDAREGGSDGSDSSVGPGDASDGGSDSGDGSVGPTDASEGGFTTPITPNEVQCGAQPPCQPPALQCCATGDATSCNALTGICTSQFDLKCDGPEDCNTSGDVCCSTVSDFQTQCVAPASCDTSSMYVLCHDHTQCGASAPNCCPIYSGSWPALGECDTRTSISGVGACDTP